VIFLKIVREIKYDVFEEQPIFNFYMNKKIAQNFLDYSDLKKSMTQNKSLLVINVIVKPIDPSLDSFLK